MPEGPNAGYLPGDVFGCLIFFGVIALVYLLLGMIWFGMCAAYQSELMTIQVGAFAV
jgi:hypothetical protein